MTGVHIRGGGIAALCAQHLLTQAGIPTLLESKDRPRLPAILLSDAALHLLRDVFGKPALFQDLAPLTTRVVAWHRNEPPVELPHRAIVVSEEQLLSALASDSVPPLDPPDWNIYAARPQNVTELQFGTRRAAAALVQLTADAPLQAFWIEALPQGWLFLIPRADRTGWMLSVGVPELRDSKLIAPLVQSKLEDAGTFPAYPRLLESLHGERWLACGTAAMAFDPICGDGTANAVREAILAAAVLRAIHRGLPAGPLLEHYTSRLLSGFARHLVFTRDFYLSGERGNWWVNELDGLQSGLAWCRAQLGAVPEYNFRLDGFDLYPINQ